jgi:hypothetical protein
MIFLIMQGNNANYQDLMIIDTLKSPKILYFNSFERQIVQERVTLNNPTLPLISVTDRKSQLSAGNIE